MKRLTNWLKKITPQRMAGIQVLYISLVLALAFTLGNVFQAVYYEGRVMERSEYWSLVEFDFDSPPDVFNIYLFFRVAIWFIIFDGTFLGVWLIARSS